MPIRLSVFALLLAAAAVLSLAVALPGALGGDRGISGHAEYIHALGRVTQQRHFRLEGRFHYLIMPSDIDSFDVQFTAPDHLTERWEFKQHGLPSGIERYRRRASRSVLQAILDSLLAPRGTQPPFFPGQGYSLRHVIFDAARTGRFEVVTVSARGYPWVCMPLYSACAIPPAIYGREDRYIGVLQINSSTGLPVRYTSQDTLRGRVYQGQVLTFIYA